VASERTRLAAGARVRVRGDEWTVQSSTAHHDCHAVRLTGCGATNSRTRRTFLLPFDRVEPCAEGTRIRVVSRKRWAHCLAQALLSSHPFGGLRAAAGASFELLPFQLEPALAVLRHARARVLIADGVGLGKTIQAGILLNELAEADEAFRAIVLTPAGLREQWQRELAARFSLQSTLADSSWLLDRARDLPSDINPWSLPGIYVASLDLVKRPEVLRAVQDVTWDAAVVDEAHGAGPGTARLAAARAIGARSRRIVLLTATPPDGDPAHFAAITEIGRDHEATPMTEFRRTRGDAGLAARRKTILLPISLSAAEVAMHRLLERYTTMVWHEAGARQDARARLAAVILRKRALSSAASLALSVQRRLAILGSPVHSVEQQLALPLGDEDPLDDTAPDEIIGASGLADVRLERDCLEEIAAAATLAMQSESKLRRLLRLLGRIDEPAVVFTEYRDTLTQIASALPGRQRPLVLHGALQPHERSAVQRAFNSSEMLLLATDAASEGLNLHERCRLVVHFELPWTPMRLEQRTGRVDRLGQTRSVHELLLVARDTAERFVLAPLLKRVRAAAARSPRALTAFDDSSVANSVMEGVVPEPVASVAPVATDTVDLRDEARIEVRRLSLMRRLERRAAAQRQRQHSDICVHVGRRVGIRAALVLVRFTLTDGAGRPVHAELVPVSAPAEPPPSTPTVEAIAAWTRRFIDRNAWIVVSAVHAHCAVRTGMVRAQVNAMIEAAVSREHCLLADAPSSPRPLVQAGLFDNRALRLAAFRTEVAARFRSDAELRLGSLRREGSLSAAAEIVAVRLDDSFPP